MKSRVLALDTTSEFGSIALIERDAVVEQVPLHAPEGYGHVLFNQLSRLLARHGWKVEDIDCFAAASGPGSFTGVRVGLAAVKGLAEVAGKPLVAVSNLRAVASFGSADLRAVVLDARRGEIYGAVYDSGLQVVHPETVSRFPDWLASLPETDLEFISTDFAPFRQALAGSRFAALVVTQAPRALAAAIGSIAARSFERGEAADPATVDANYVRRSDAELSWKDPKVS